MSYTHHVPTAIIGLSASRSQALYSMLQRWMVPALVHQDMREALPLLLSARPQTLLLYAGTEPTLALQLARRAKSELSDLSIVLLTDHDDLGLAREAVKLNLRGLVVLGTDDDELVALFIRMSEEVYDPVHTGRVIAIAGAKGGVGTSCLAINLAGALPQADGGSVALIDLAPCAGELGVFLDLDTPYSLSRLLREMHLLDQEYIDASIPRHPRGFFVLAQPLVPDKLTELTHEELIQSIRILQRHFSYIVLDAGGVLSTLSLTAATTADTTLVVTTPSLPSIVSARRRLDILDRRGRDPRTTGLLLNRYGEDPRFDVNQVLELTNRRVTTTLQFNPGLMDEALRSGSLLFDIDPSARLSQEMLALAAHLSGHSASGAIRPMAEPTEPRRKKLFGLF